MLSKAWISIYTQNDKSELERSAVQHRLALQQQFETAEARTDTITAVCIFYSTALTPVNYYQQAQQKDAEIARLREETSKLALIVQGLRDTIAIDHAARLAEEEKRKHQRHGEIYSDQRNAEFSAFNVPVRDLEREHAREMINTELRRIAADLAQHFASFASNFSERTRHASQASTVHSSDGLCFALTDLGSKASSLHGAAMHFVDDPSYGPRFHEQFLVLSKSIAEVAARHVGVCCSLELELTIAGSSDRRRVCAIRECTDGSHVSQHGPGQGTAQVQCKRSGTFCGPGRCVRKRPDKSCAVVTVNT